MVTDLCGPNSLFCGETRELYTFSLSTRALSQIVWFVRVINIAPSISPMLFEKLTKRNFVMNTGYWFVCIPVVRYFMHSKMHACIDVIGIEYRNICVQFNTCCKHLYEVHNLKIHQQFINNALVLSSHLERIISYDFLPTPGMI